MNPNAAIAAMIEESYALERSGDVGAALRTAREALGEAERGGDPATIAVAMVCVAYILDHLGHYDQAQALAEEALTHAAPDARSRADALRILGDCAHEAGDLATAEGFYLQAVDLGRQLSYRYVVHRCLHSLSACVYIPRGQFDLALAADEESLRLAGELGKTEEIWLPLLTKGWVLWVTGQRELALAVSEEMRRVVQPGSLAEGYWCCLRGDLVQDGEQPEAALSLYARARSIAESTGDPGLGAELRLGLSRYHRSAGNAPSAYDWADDALTIARRAGSYDLRGSALIERGRAAWHLGNHAEAEADLRAAIELLLPMHASFDLARAYLLLTGLLYEQGSARAESAWVETISHIAGGGYAFLLERERSLAFPLLAAYLNSEDPNLAALSARLLEHLGHVPPPVLSVVTLGRFAVSSSGGPVDERAWRRRRAGDLFRLLLVSRGHSLLHEQVTEALWPDKPPGSVSALLHQATSSLRRALEPDLPDKFPSRYLAVEEGQVTLYLPPGSSVDFETFEQHIAGEAWEAALALYRGDLLPGDRYADWAAPLRERLRHHAIRAAVGVARQRLEAGDAVAALDASRRALQMEPWQEEAVLLGMQACVALNDRAGALRLYLDLAQRLRDEIGTTPQADLQHYYRSLL